MEWDKWEVFWGDERAVPPEHLDSNYRMARESLLSKVPITEVWRIRGEAEDLHEAADEYARTIKSRLGLGLPVFDTILLGMGADGHTASLFPGSPALESTSLVEAVEVNQPIAKRLTLTMPVLNAARQVIFLVTGSEKAGRVRDVIERDDLSLPSARVVPDQGDCTWILDQAAANLIR
jgi:6-phosphogluconolactonase